MQCSRFSSGERQDDGHACKCSLSLAACASVAQISHCTGNPTTLGCYLCNISAAHGTRLLWHPIPGAVAFLANARARCCDAACILKHIFMCFSSFAACSQSQILPEQCQPGVPRNCSLLQRYGRKTRFIQESRILLATTKCTTRRSGAKMAAMSLAPTLQF